MNHTPTGETKNTKVHFVSSDAQNEQSPTLKHFTFVASVFKPVTGSISPFNAWQILTNTNHSASLKGRPTDLQRLTQAIRCAGALIHAFGEDTSLYHIRFALDGNWNALPYSTQKAKAQKIVQGFSADEKAFALSLIDHFEDEGTQTPKQLKTLFKNSLPSAIFSGIIPAGGKKSRLHIAGHTGYFGGDLDHLRPDQFEAIRSIIAGNPFVQMAFRSPSGDGLKFVLLSDFEAGDYPAAYLDKVHAFVMETQVEPYFNGLLSDAGFDGVVMDESCRNIERHCFLPFDPKATFKVNPQPFEIDKAAIHEFISELQKADRAKAEKKKQADELRKANGQSLVQYEVDEALERAVSYTDKHYQYKAGGRYQYLFNLAATAKRLGIEREVIEAYVEENIISPYGSSTSASDPFEVYNNDSYPFGTWLKTEKPKAPIFKYVSECANLIKDAIGQTQKNWIEAPAGAGKTFAILAKEGNKKSPDYIGIGRQIINEDPAAIVRMVFPTIALTDQSAKAKDHEVEVFTGGRGLSGIDARISEESRLAAVNYHTLLQTLPHDLSKTHIFIDEAHIFFLHAYMNEGDLCGRILDALRGCKSVTFISATPPPQYILDGLRINLIRLPIEAKNKVECDIKIYKGSQRALLANELPKLDFNKGVSVIRLNNIKRAKVLNELCADLMPEGKRICLINSDNRNADYEYLIEHNKLPDDVGLCFVTSFLDVGVNINNQDIQRAVFIDSEANNRGPDFRDCIQFAARFRSVPTLSFTHYTKDRSGKSFDPLKWVKGEVGLINSYLRGRKSFLKVQDSGGYSTIPAPKIDGLKHIRTNHKGDPTADLLAVYQDAHKQYISNLSTAKYFEELLRMAPNFELVQKSEMDPQANEKSEEIEDRARDIEKQADTTIYTLIASRKHYTRVVLEAIYHGTSSNKLRHLIRKKEGLFKDISTAASEILKDNIDAIKNTSGQPIRDFYKMSARGFDQVEVSAVWGKLSEDYKQSQLQTLRSREARIVDTIHKLKDSIDYRSQMEAQNMENANKARKDSRKQKYLSSAIFHAEKRKGFRGQITTLEKDLIETRATIEAKDETQNIEFAASDFRDFIYQWDLLLSIEFARTAKTQKAARQHYKKLDADRIIQQGKALRRFASNCRNWNNKALGQKAIRTAWLKVGNNGFAPDPVSSDPAYIRAFKALFDVVECGGKYRAKCKNTAQKSAHFFGFSFSEFCKKNGLEMQETQLFSPTAFTS